MKEMHDSTFTAIVTGETLKTVEAVAGVMEATIIFREDGVADYAITINAQQCRALAAFLNAITE